MKVLIKSEKKKLTIILPTALLLNRLAATVAVKIITSKQPSIDVSVEDLMKLVNTIKKYKQKHKNWEVVNICSADGEKVYISL